MTTATTINLQDAGLFSSLAYAPNGVADSIAWGLSQPGTYVYQYAWDLKAAGWTDITGTLLTLSGNPKLNYEANSTNTSFHVYENSVTHQVIIAFRGSTPPGLTGQSLANWAADLTPTDQGYSSYQGIAPGALKALDLIEGTLDIPASNILVDGHSLGGGIAQTFAAANSLNGFAENPLPISPTSLSNIAGLSTEVANYHTTNVFQIELLQGDVAAALYQGETFLDADPVWLSSSYEETETQLVNSMGTHWYSNIGNTLADVSLLRTAIAAHNLDNLNTQAAIQFSDDGTPLFTDTGDLTTTQAAIKGLINTLTGLPVVNWILGGVESRVSSILVGASGPGAIDDGTNPNDGIVRVSGLGAPSDVLTGSNAQPSVLYGDSGTDLLIAGSQPTTLVAGSGTDYLVATGTNTADGGTGSDTFIFDLSQVTANSTETIENPSGTDSVVVNTIAGYTTLLGGPAVTGTPNTWESNGVTYTFTGLPDASVGSLTITGGVLNSTFTNTIVINDFNISKAQTAVGFMGIVLPAQLSLDASADAGVDPPAPNFQAGSDQSYTLSVDAPSTSAQTITVQLSGAPQSTFDALVGTTLVPITNGTFNVVLPAGQTNISFALENLTGFAATNLSLSASIPDAANPSGTPIAATPLSFEYLGAPSTGAIVADAMYGFNGSPGYFADYPMYTPGFLDLARNATLQGATVAQGSPTGDAWVWLNNANTSIVAAGDNDTILAEYGWPFGVGGGGPTGGIGGSDVIVATGHHDVIQNDSGLLSNSGPVQIFASGLESLSTAITAAQTGTGTGQQGDLILGGSEANTTIVGSNGNDFITNASGNDVVVAGSGNDIIVGGVKSSELDRYWGEFGENGQDAPDASLIGSFGWQASVVNGNLSIGGGFIDVGDYPGADPDPATPSTFVPAPANYEGNFDSYGNIVGLGNETIFGGDGASLILLSNGNNYVDLGPGNSTVRGGMGSNTVIGGSGAQFIAGGGGSDYLTAGSGNSTIGGNGGNNTIFGGSGVDLLEAGGGGPDFATIETGDNYVFGGSGSGTIFGSGGADTLIGGTGNYTIFGGAGLELVTGGSGNDLLIGGAGNDTIDAGGSGADSIQANGSSSSTSYLYGGGGSDSILGGSGANVIYAGDGGVAGAATSVFASSSDASATTTIYGGLGIDQLVGGPGTAVIYAGDGGSSTAPTSVFAGSGTTTIYGGIGTDYLQGANGVDVIYAGDGGIDAAPTTVLAGSGASTIYGGAGSDLLEDVSSGNVSMIAGTGDTTVIGSGSDSIEAGSGNEFIQSNGGSITLQIDGPIGNDTVISNGGTVNLSFGTGVDSPAFSAFASIDSSNLGDLILSGEGGQLIIEGGLTGTLGSVNFADSGSMSVQQLVQSEGSDETLTGATGNLLFNVDTAAVVEGGTVGSGPVTVSAWGNNDTVFGASSGKIDVTGSGTIVYDEFAVASSSTTATGANDTVQASNSGDNVLISGANSVAMGGGSNDTLTATGTNDTLVAGLGNDVFGINATTVVENQFGHGIDTIDSSISYAAPTGINALTLVGTANLVATGNAAADLLTGGTGADTLIAGSGVATLNGGSGNTTFVVNSSSDVVESFFSATDSVDSSASFTLPTGVNLLTLTGTANLVGAANTGTDTLVSNSGVDTLIGGSGHDTFILNNAADVVQDSLGSATIIYQSSGNFSLPANVTTLTLTGTAAIHATGNSGNDLITANTGADTLSAGNGTDTLISGSGIDSLIGGTGNDLFVVNNSTDVVLDTSSTATNAVQSSVSYTLPTDVNSLLLVGSANIAGTANAVGDTLTGGVGADTLIAGSAIDTLVAGSGNTTFVINNTGDVIRETSSTTSNTVDSSVSYSLATDINSLILTGTASLVGTANAANDSLTGNSGASKLVGGAGVDTLVAGGSANTLVGGSGNTTFVLNSATDLVVDTSATATNIAMSSVSYSLPTNVNNLILTGTAALTGIANSFSDSLVGNAGADSLVAGSGFDILVAGSGVDTLVAGSGPDYFIVNSAADVLQIGAGHGAVTVDASLNYTLPTNVSELQLTGTANLTGTGNAAGGIIVGNSGHDSLISGTGLETLMAGLGIDTLIGGSAGDVFVVNNASDVVEPSASASNSVESSVSYTLPTNINALTLIGPGNIVGTGNAATDGLVAGAGNDTLVPGSGAANMFGGGDTTFVVNNTTDQVQEQFGDAQDTVQSAINFTLPANVNTLLFTGTAALVGTGNSGNDTLIANSGVDTLIGGSGNDTFVIGRTGEVIEDSLTGSSNTIDSSVSFSLLTNINTLNLTGSSNVVGTANSGADTLVANTGVDTLDGGSGNDVFVIDNAGDVVGDTSATAANSLQTSISYTLPTNVNSLTLTGGANLVGTGNGAANTLTGSFGNDTLVAGTGLATLVGGTGNTTFVVNNASDVVQDTTTYSSNTIVSSVSFTAPTNVNALVLTGAANLAAIANTGNDTLISNSGVDTLTGGTGVSVFVVNNSADIVQDASSTASVIESSASFTLGTNLNSLVLTGTSNLTGTANSANDTLTSNSGLDTLKGGAGNDTFIINNSADVVQDTSATANNVALSTVSFTLPVNVNALTLTGTASLVASGNAASDVLSANSGNDTLIAGSGVATLIGGAGNDTFLVNSSSDIVQDSATATNSTIESSVTFTLAANVNTLVLSGTGALVGTANNGNDTLVSNTGVDTLVGGSGSDLFVINNAADVIVNATANDTIESSFSYTLPAGVANLVLVGTANISATGNASSDHISAGAGIDTLTAGSGIATLIGGAGNDTFILDNASDVVEDYFTTTSNSISSSASYSLPTNVDALTLIGTANLTGTGNTDATNSLTANSGNDLIIGTALSNTMNGGAGIDTLEAGPGTNLINVGNGGTSLSPTRVLGADSQSSALTQNTIYGGSGVDLIEGGLGTDLIYAGTGNSTIESGSGSDSIYGGATGAQTLQDSLGGGDLITAGGGTDSLMGIGADTLIAGAGNDYLQGDASGKSQFILNQGFGQDSIHGSFDGAQIDNITFGPGLEPSNTTITAGTDESFSLVLAMGTSTVTIGGALLPDVVQSLAYTDTGVQNLTQLIQAHGPGLQTVTGPDNGVVSLSSSSDANIALAQSPDAEYLFAYGNNDSLSAFLDLLVQTTTAQLYSYGSGDSVTGGYGDDTVYAEGNNDVVTALGSNTVYANSTNDTIISSNNNQNGGADFETFNVSQSSTIVQVAAGPGDYEINASASFILPTNVQQLSLTASGITATSNAQGGTLIAEGNADTLIGGSGQDSLEAIGANAVLIGGTGNETFYINSATDSLQFNGSPSNDTVVAGINYTLTGGANTLEIGNGLSGTANNGTDTLTGVATDPFVTMIGGSGNDTFVVNNPSDVVEDTSTTASNMLEASVSYTLPTDVNSLVLTTNNLLGTANGASDTLIAQGSADTLVAGTGSDVLENQSAGSTTFVFNAGFGDDKVTVGQGDTIAFGPGITQSSLTFSALLGTAGVAPSLIISGDGGSVTVQGGLVPGAIAGVNFSGSGTETVPQLVAPSGRVTVTGSSGNLILSPNNSDTVTGGSGQDTIDAWGTGDSLAAGTGGSLIYAGGGSDQVTGGAGNDTLVAIGAADTLTGGSGNEILVINNSSAIVNVSAGIGHDTLLSSVSFIVPTNVLLMTMTGSAAVQATGNSGNDTIVANSGNDTIISGSGTDSLVGGSGSDLFIVSSAADVVQNSFSAANDTIQSTISFTLPTNVSSLLLSGTGNLAATGNTGNDTLVGGGGNDSLIAGAGADNLVAGSGASTLVSGGGVDTLVGGTGIDLFIVNNSADVLQNSGTNPYYNDSVDSAVNFTLTAPVSKLTLTGSANLIAEDPGLIQNGFSFGDVAVTGNAGNDTLIGLGFNDTVVAGSGIDTLEGGGPASGTTTYMVDNTSDVILAQAGGAGIAVSAITYSLANTPFVDTLELTGSANITGTASNDAAVTIDANQGSDTLVAGSGSDSLLGGEGFGGAATEVAGSGADFLQGRTGSTFVLNPGFGADTIQSGTSGTVQFGAGISATNLTAEVVLDSLSSPALLLTDGSGSALLDLALSGTTYQYKFNTGASLSQSQFLSEVNVTTSSVAGASGNVILEGTPSTAITGGTGNDTIYAAAASDTINGGSGNQVLSAMGANDYILGGSNSDTLSAFGTNDSLVAGSAVDTLIGGTGATVAFFVNNTGDAVQLQSSPGIDTLSSSVAFSLPANLNTLILTGAGSIKGTANSGADTLTSNTGVDTLVGGSGSDLFIVNNASDVVQDTSNSAVNTIQTAFAYVLPTDVNNLILTGTAALTGTANNAVDTLTSNTGVDTLTGGTGNDTFILNNAADVVQDTTSTTSNTIKAAFSYSLPTNVNSLVLTGSGNLTGVANGGTDTLTSNSGTDTLVGGGGNDTFVINNTSDVIQDTSTTATNSAQSSVNFTLATNVNSLTLTGTGALVGTANGGTDTLTSNTGLDTLVGGGGNDTFVINNSNDVIQDTSTTATNTAKSAVSYSLAANVNTLTLTGTAALTGTANSGNDALTGNSGADTLIGGAGVDTLTAGTGINTLIGGTGNTTFVVNNASDVVQDTSGSSSNTLRSSVTYVLPTNVNALVLTGTSALKGTANGGNDTLTSNTGVDTLVGGAGNDTFIISNASDIVQDTSGTATNIIQASVAFTLPTDVNTLTFTGSTALHGTGNAGNDSMTANSGADTLSAGNGTDTLVSGTAGADSLVGGTGNDLFIVNFASDIVNVGATHGTDTIQAAVTYTAAANVANLTLSGTAALTGTGNSTAIKITANSGADTLTAGTGVATLVGGSGNDTFVVNSTSDVIQDTSTSATNILSSSVSYTLPTNVNRLILTGTAALVATANSGNDTLTANTGADTLVSGAGTAVDSLVAGTGADLFVVNNASDIVTVGGTHGVDTVQSSVSYTASTNVANLTLTGTSALAATGNSLAGTITANTGNDTLTAGTGADTLVSSSTGTDLFVVNSASDVVSLGTSGTSDSIQSSASYTLPTNVQYLNLSGTSALTGTGNTLTDLIVGNSGADTLVGGTGIAVLEGGRTAGSDQIKASSNQAALIGGAAASTLTGGAFKDFYAAGTVSDSITTGATANVVSVNKGDGATTLAPTTSATNVLSLGAGIDTESLFFTKTGNNLILTDGVTGDSITFTNWYAGAADQDYTTLQVVEIASANYNSGGGDGLRNKALEAFNFTALVAAYNTAGSPANWALSTAMPTTSLATTSTADYGGDLAYYFGLNGNLTGMDLSAAQSTLTNASFGTATQTIDAFSGISGGGGLHLSVALPPQRITPIREPQFRDGEDLVSAISPEFGIQLRPSAGSPDANIATLNEQSDQNLVINMGPDVELPSAASTAAASVPAAANTESLGPRLRLPEDNAAFGDFTLDEDSRLDTARVIASPQVRDGVAPEVSTIQTPATSQAMTAGSISELSGIPVSTGQLIASPSVMPGVNIPSAFQPQISLSDDFLRDIAPRLALPVSPGAAPATSGIEAPPMSSALSVAPPMVTTEPSEIFGPPNISESQGSAVLMQEDGIAQRLISPGRLPQLLDYVLPASAESPIASVQPTIATARIGATITPVKVSDIATMLDSSNVPPPVIPQASINWSESLPNNLVDPINVAWLTMHDALNQSNSMPIGGSEVPSNPSVGANDALVAGGPIDRMQRIPDELELHSQRLHQRAM